MQRQAVRETRRGEASSLSGTLLQTMAVCDADLIHVAHLRRRGPALPVGRYRSEKATDADGWRHVRIVLEPTNPDFAPIELTADDEDSVAVVAELVEVIGTTPPA